MALEFPASPTDGQVYNNFRWNASDDAWRLIPIAGDLNSLDDVATNSPNDGDILVYNTSTSQWVPSSRVSLGLVIALGG
jgi:hypothetical protein